MSTQPELGGLLDEQRAYCRALAPDYLSHELDLPGYGELAEALEEFRPAGSVLELACGPGVWTRPCCGTRSTSLQVNEKSFAVVG